jgi:NADH-quinone oxidoreductase subunit K
VTGPSATLSLLATTVPLDRTVLLACALFAVGLVGVTCRRNILIVLLSVEILLNAANLAFVAFSKVHADVTGQVFVFFSMTVAAAEVAVGLAIVIAVYRLRRTVDVSEVRDLREVDYGRQAPLRLEGEDAHHEPHDEPHAGPEAGGHSNAHPGEAHAGLDHAHAAPSAHAGGGH